MNKENAQIISNYLDELFPNPKTPLNYSKDYEFLIAVMLSAQTTDKGVNKVTPVLFTKYKSLDELKNAKLEEVENIIAPIGMKNKKAKNIIAIASSLSKLDSFPLNKEKLMELPGVGNKTAEVVLVELTNQQYFPVDTHINRIAKRLGIAKEKDDVILVEEKLSKFFPKEKWKDLHKQIIYFGRSICNASSPKCKECKICAICKKKPNF